MFIFSIFLTNVPISNLKLKQLLVLTAVNTVVLCFKKGL